MDLVFTVGAYDMHCMAFNTFGLELEPGMEGFGTHAVLLRQLGQPRQRHHRLPAAVSEKLRVEMLADILAQGLPKVSDLVKVFVLPMAVYMEDGNYYIPLLSRYIIEHGGYEGLDRTMIPSATVYTLRGLFGRLLPGTPVGVLDERWLREKAWEVRSAGQGSKGERWYAWAWLATASPRHSLLVRRHLKTGELAFCYCYVPAGQLVSKARLIRAAGLRWPVEESFEPGKGCFGLDQCQARLYTAILRHIVLVMAAFAVCALTAAEFRDRTDTQAPPPASPDAAPPADPGLIPLTVREIRRLLAGTLARPHPPGHTARWLEWRRRHQARSRWFHKHARLQRNYALVS